MMNKLLKKKSQEINIVQWAYYAQWANYEQLAYNEQWIYNEQWACYE